MPIRLARLIRMTAALAVLAAAQLGAVPALAATGSGWVRLANLSSARSAVTVLLYSFSDPRERVMLKDASYGEVAPYQRVPAGAYIVTVSSATAARAKPILTGTVKVLAGQAYTVATVGEAAQPRLQVLRDRLTAPRGRALLRVIQASLREPLITVTADGRDVARRLLIGRVQGYTAVRPGTVTLRAAGPSQSASVQTQLSGGGVYTAIMLDISGHLKIKLLEDAAASEVAPAASAPMGLGGTAGRPGWPLRPWLLTALAGLFAAAAGGWWRRQLRRAAVAGPEPARR